MKTSTKYATGFLVVAILAVAIILANTKLQIGAVRERGQSRDNPATVTINRKSPPYQYTVTLADKEGIAKFNITAKDDSNIFSSNGFGCGKKTESYAITIPAANFPLKGKVTDCTGKSTNFTAISMPAFSGDTAATVTVEKEVAVQGTVAPVDTRPYKFSLSDDQGLYEIYVTSPDGTTLGGGFLVNCDSNFTTGVFDLTHEVWPVHIATTDCVGGNTSLDLQDPDPPPPMPDLIITGVTFGENEQGTKTFTITAKNQGNAPTTGRVNWFVQYYHADENNYFAATSGYFKYGSPNSQQFFAGGEENSDTHVMPDADRLEFQVNPVTSAGHVDESDFLNNSFTAYPPSDSLQDETSNVDFDAVDLDQDLPFNPFNP